MSVCAQYRLAVLGFLNLKDLIGVLEASAHRAFEDQRSVMVWVQDNAVALAFENTEVIVFGYDTGGWLVCHRLQHFGQNMAFNLFSGAIMQPGFCSDTNAERLQHQSDKILARCRVLFLGFDIMHID